MNKIYLTSAIATFGLFASTSSILGQAAGGAAGGGTSASGAVGGVNPGARVGGASTARSGTVGNRAATTTRGLNTAGAASIAQPATTPPIGGASVVGTAPNAVGGSVSGNTILSTPGGGGTVGANAVLPGGGSVLNQQAISATSLPAPVQSTLRSFTANGTVAGITQVQGLNGPVYQAQVTQNGTPVQLEISQTGQILSRTVAGTSTGPITAANTAAATLGNAQAGLPVSSLPASVQSSLQAQLGANGQVQTVSRDDLANGTVFRVTTTQNGVPTEMRFAANGTLLSSAPLAAGAATSAFTPLGTSGAIVPGSSVVLGDLPSTVQSAIRSQLGNGRLNQITQQTGANGQTYTVSYDQNGRPMLMTIGPDGRILRNAPMTGVGSSAAGTTGTAASSNAPAVRTNATTRTSMKLDQLPDAVQQSLKRTAPLAEVRSVSREQRVGGDVYTIGVRTENSVGDLVIASDGRIVTDNRKDFAQLSVPPVILDDEQVTGIPFATVPVAIQDAVKAYATASDIRSITLGADRDGRAVYDVVFYRDGRRDRMVVAKDGTLRRIEQNVSPALEIPDPRKAPVIALGDLPQAVQDTVRRQTDKVRVKDIGSKQIGSETVYQVHYETNGAPVELLVGTDGRVVLPEGSLDREPSSSPRPAPIRPDELASAKVAKESGESVGSGAAAPSERGTVKSNSSKPSNHSDVNDKGTAEESASTKVNLSDVPVPVQNTAKKLAGSATIDSISPKLSDAGVGYDVTFMQNGVRKTVRVNKDGVVVKE